MPWRATDYPIEIAEIIGVSRELDKMLSSDEHHELIDYLAFHPECGDVMRGTGGIRKMRWRFNQKGKRGGLRILYYFHDLNMPLYVLAVYSKGELLKITKREEQEMSKLVIQLVNECASKVCARLESKDNPA